VGLPVDEDGFRGLLVRKACVVGLDEVFERFDVAGAGLPRAALGLPVPRAPPGLSGWCVMDRPSRSGEICPPGAAG
jgi:hypothetical protein